MRVFSVILAVLVISLASWGCAEGEPPKPSSRTEENVVTVLARGLEFEAPDEIPSGWTTFRFVNESNMVHFALVQRMPPGIGIADHQEQVAPVFQQGYESLVRGESDAAMAKFGELPEWYGAVEFFGGPGLTSGSRTSATTVYLEPGRYVLECYVKTNGIFHSYNPAPDAYGMVHEFTVTEMPHPAPEPDASIRITLSAAAGMDVQGDIRPGRQVVSVRFQDQKAHENFVGHDVHLARLPDEMDTQTLAEWMDWTREEGLATPSPVEFLGGVNEMPAGSVAYLVVDLAPGRYAWVAEVPGAMEKGLLHVFNVPSESHS